MLLPMSLVALVVAQLAAVGFLTFRFGLNRGDEPCLNIHTAPGCLATREL